MKALCGRGHISMSCEKPLLWIKIHPSLHGTLVIPPVNDDSVFCGAAAWMMRSVHSVTALVIALLFRCFGGRNFSRVEVTFSASLTQLTARTLCEKASYQPARSMACQLRGAPQRHAWRSLERREGFCVRESYACAAQRRAVLA